MMGDYEPTSGVCLCMICGSSQIDIKGWKGLAAITECAGCGSQGVIVGVSIGRAELSVDQIRQAINDMAIPKNLIKDITLGKEP